MVAAARAPGRRLRAHSCTGACVHVHQGPGRTHALCSWGSSPPQPFMRCSAHTPELPLLGHEHGHGPKHAPTCVRVQVRVCLLTQAPLTSSQHSGFSPILAQPGFPHETPESELVPKQPIWEVIRGTVSETGRKNRSITICSPFGGEREGAAPVPF